MLLVVVIVRNSNLLILKAIKKTYLTCYCASSIGWDPYFVWEHYRWVTFSTREKLMHIPVQVSWDRL